MGEIPKHLPATVLNQIAEEYAKPDTRSISAKINKQGKPVLLVNGVTVEIKGEDQNLNGSGD